MGFYLSKLQEYSSAPKTYGLNLSDRMFYAKEQAEQIMDKHYQFTLSVCDNFLVNSAPSTDFMGYQAAIRMQNNDKLNQMSEEIKMVKDLTPEEYFAYLNSREGTALIAYISTRQKDAYEKTDMLCKVSSSTGIFAKLNEISGYADRKIEELTDEVNLRTGEEETGKEALTEWANLSPEMRLEYLVGRIENQGLIYLDQEGLDSYALTNPSLINASPMQEETDDMQQ